jgi:hypothetical protein
MKERKMKKKNEASIAWIIAFVLVTVFSMAACGGGGSGGGGNYGNPITPPVDPPDYPDPGTQTPIASDYDIRNVFQYEGNVTAVTITPKQGKSTGAVTIFYNGSTTLPSAAGTYTITFNVAAASGWNAAPGLAGGTLTINSQNQPGYQYPAAGDYIISGTGTYTYDGTVRTVTITPKEGKSPGAITIDYNGSTTAPSAVGNYTVTFSVAAVEGWNAMYSLAGGTLTITKAAGATAGVPTLNSITQNSITIYAVTAPGNGQSVEYGISASNNASTAVWQTALTFNGLSAGTTYYIFARAAGNSNYETGAASGSLAVTMSNPGTTGITIDVKQITDGAPIINSITISRSNNGHPVTYSVSVEESGYDAITWEIAGVGDYANQTVTGSGPSFTLDAADVSYNSLGGHALILTVIKDGQQYQRAIPFTIVL